MEDDIAGWKLIWIGLARVWHFVGQENLILARLFGEVIEDISAHMLENWWLAIQMMANHHFFWFYILFFHLSSIYLLFLSVNCFF